VLPSKLDFLAHVRCLRAAAKAQGTELLLATDSMQAMLRRDGRFWVLHPQFIAVRHGVTQYVRQLDDDVTHFAGWLPYRLRRWPEAMDKLVFKERARQAGLRVPEHGRDPAVAMSDVVVKRAMSSFATQVHGPYRQSSEHALDLAAGDYHERFIDGRLLKLWCWGGQAIGVEVDPMPTVFGNGHSTLEQLIDGRSRLARPQTAERLATLLARSEVVLRYDGRTLADVLEPGQCQRVEFRYGSELMHPRDRQLVDLQASIEARWEPLREAARTMAGWLPDELRDDTVFTVDAVLDIDDRAWLLEMNCNPMVHPLLYQPMLDTLMAHAAPAAPALIES
jgi:hypothetical protein